MESSHETDAAISAELVQYGLLVDFRPTEEGQPIPVGFQGILTDEIRKKITTVFQEQIASDVQLQFGVTERQLVVLRATAFRQAMLQSKMSYVELIYRCEKIVKEERMRDIERTDDQKKSLGMVEKLRTELLFHGVAGDDEKKAIHSLDEISRILRYSDGRRLDCIGSHADRVLLFIEKGERLLNRDTAAVLAKVLEIQVEQLLVVPDENIVDLSGELDFPLSGDGGGDAVEE